MPHKKFQLYRPLKIGSCRFVEVLYCNFNREIGPKMIIGHNFWLGSPIDTSSTRLNCILPYLVIFGSVFERAKYGQVRYPWKDLAKCCSDARGKSINIFWGGLPTEISQTANGPLAFEDLVSGKWNDGPLACQLVAKHLHTYCFICAH